MVVAMAKVRWLVENGRHTRPDGAVDVRILMDRFREYMAVCTALSYEEQLGYIASFVKLPVEELFYLADVGEWLEVERKSSEIENDDDYEDYWDIPNNHPSMNYLYRVSRLSRSPEEEDEISYLNDLYYNQA